MMTPADKEAWWQRTIAALENRDPRVHLALLTALILRNGELREYAPGKTGVTERVSIEELLHTVDGYHFAVRVPETGVVEIQAIAKGDVDGIPPEPGQPNRHT